MLALIDVTSVISALVGAVVIIGVMAGVSVYRKNRSDALHKTDGESIGTWKSLAESRFAKITDLQRENEDLTEEVKRLTTDLGECEKLRNEFALFNLRLQAKNAIYEKCINRFEIELKLPVTNFDDPTPAHFGR